MALKVSEIKVRNKKIFMSRNLIIDTNLLLLLVIGAVEEGRHIASSKRLDGYTKDDYDRVWAIVSDYDKVYITPYIATEISNLIDLTGHSKEIAYQVAYLLFTKFFEIETEINVDCSHELFTAFGITDCSLMRLSAQYNILTADHRLCTLLYAVAPNNVVQYN